MCHCPMLTTFTLQFFEMINVLTCGSLKIGLNISNNLHASLFLSNQAIACFSQSSECMHCNLINCSFAVGSTAEVSGSDIGIAEVSLVQGESNTTATDLLPLSFLSCGSRSMVINLLFLLNKIRFLIKNMHTSASGLS